MHNLPLLPRMPSLYAIPSDRKPLNSYSTHYRVFTGKGTAFEECRGLHVESDFPDGTGNTYLIVETAEAIPWTKPDDLSYDPHGPLPQLGFQFPSGFLSVKVNGSVRKTDHDKATEEGIRARIT